MCRRPIVQHFTQDVEPGKRRTLRKLFQLQKLVCFSITVSAGEDDRAVLWGFLRRRLLSGAYSLRSKALFTIALVEHIRYIPTCFKVARNGSTVIPGFV